MHITRTLAALASTATLVGAAALPTVAHAATPAPNDTWQDAVTIDALPAGDFVFDTSAATTDATDALVNTTCGAPFTNASVWFKYTDTTGAGIQADLSGSDYSGGFIITAGEPTSAESLVACGPTVTAAKGQPGTTYYIAAFSDSEVNGGELTARFTAAPAAPTTSLTVNPRGTADKDGAAVIGGSYSCTDGDLVNGITGELVQRVGRTKITGTFDIYPVTCDGTTRTWEALVESNNGLFAGGKAANLSIAYACNMMWECAESSVDATIQLSRASTKK